jgi:hypothetical protein
LRRNLGITVTVQLVEPGKIPKAEGNTLRFKDLRDGYVDSNNFEEEPPSSTFSMMDSGMMNAILSSPTEMPPPSQRRRAE